MKLNAALRVFTELEKQTVGWVDDLEQVGRTAVSYTVRLDANYAANEPPEERRFYTLFVRQTNVVDETIDAMRFVLELAEEHGLTVGVENDGIRLY